jgi:hypothetical protein
MLNQTVQIPHKLQLNLTSFRFNMLKRTITFLVATLGIFVFGEDAADAAAHLISKVIIAPASEPMTMLMVGSGLVLVASYWRKNISKK